MLPSCDGCLVFSINSTARNIHKLLELLNIKTEEREITARSLYLLGKKKQVGQKKPPFVGNIHQLVLLVPARETSVKDSDLEHFKQQASCLGFSGEPDFRYDPKKGSSSLNLSMWRKRVSYQNWISFLSAEFCREGEGIKVPFSWSFCHHKQTSVTEELKRQKVTEHLVTVVLFLRDINVSNMFITQTLYKHNLSGDALIFRSCCYLQM